MEQLKLYYLTAATGVRFIKDQAQYALKSLLRWIPSEDIYCCVNTEADRELVQRKVPELQNVPVLNEPLGHIKWTYMKGKRKYSVFKAAALHKTFPEPVEDSALVYFDGDVLFYKDPTEYLRARAHKTWFHHGKYNAKLAKRRTGKTLTPADIDMTSRKSLGQWVSVPCAYLMMRHGSTALPEKQVCAGFFVLHPRDHEVLLRVTYEYCQELAPHFKDSPDVGDQKPMNAAISVHNIDFHGGDRLLCPEHTEVFDHFFGTKAARKAFDDKVRTMGL